MRFSLSGLRKKEEVLKKSNIKLGLKSVDKYEAINMAGKLLVESGYVEKEYVQAMVQREDSLTTYIGNGVAIPHGIGDARKYIKKSGIIILQFPDGVDFDGEKAYLVIGIAGVGDEHIDILSNIATIIGDDDMEKLDKILKSNDSDYLYKIFTTN